MSDPVFFQRPEGISVGDLAARIGIPTVVGDSARIVAAVGPLDEATPDTLSFIDNPRYRALLAGTRAGAVICAEKDVEKVPPGTAALVSATPYRSFARATALLYPEAVRPPGMLGEVGGGVSAAAFVDPSARLEAGAVVEPGAAIGAGAEIGARTVVAATAVVGAGVRIGRDSYVGAGASLQHALVGNRVIIHPGVRIGQDGFGFAMGAGGHLKVPQIGRVVIQDDVEIGANTTIDRGSNRDTIVGEGTKIDNQVQIGHNVVVGRHCVIVAQAGVSGSTVLEDYVVLAGKVGLAGHLRIGQGAQVAGGSNVADDIPAGERWVGTPARPIRQWMQELMALTALGRERRSGGSRKDEEPKA
jgi:UDP-3-O-[3-hydroxymyristoyl] glucosamine N-acyltransferase